LATVQEGYNCLLGHYVKGKVLDDRVLLQGAYSYVVSSLQHFHIPLPAVSPMQLTGKHDADWQAFKRTIDALNNGLPHSGLIPGAVAYLSLLGMTGSLKDDHTSYLPTQFIGPLLAQLNEGPSPSYGIVTSPITNTIKLPIYVADVYPNSPAANAGVLAGDTITQLNGVAPAPGGQASAGLVALLLPQEGAQISLTASRPATGTTKTVTLAARSLVAPTTTSRALPGGAAYVKLYQFTSHASDRVFSAIRKLAVSTKLTGVVLDLRGNEGGDANQATRLISAFIHKGVIGYTIDSSGKRVAQRTDDKVPLLHLPLAVLIDGGSASSSELVAGAVRDLNAGRVVGERSMGALAEAEFYGLNDGSGLEITEARVLGPKAEKVDGIGIQPNQIAATTAGDLSAGRDPAIQLAVQYIQTVAPAR
jgi:carboxyl-terminal processing protease